MSIGHQALALFFHLQSTGTLGDRLTLPNGSTAHRLEETHARDYRSVFGNFTLHRTVYGTREGQKLDFVPLDARLQLPASDYSYLLQSGIRLWAVSSPLPGSAAPCSMSWE